MWHGRSLVALAWVCAVAVAGTPREISLPIETAVLRSSELPGYQIAKQKCGICHSADYINLQPPHMSLAQWTAEMVKMQHAYGAPIDEAEIKLLGVYLAVTYGNAASVSAADAALTLPEVAPAGVQALLKDNACLSCHALREKIIGPAYHDVANKYKNDPQGAEKLQAGIRGGGSGMWGEVAMPPFPGLSQPELQALADFVLRQ